VDLEECRLVLARDLGVASPPQTEVIHREILGL
jgi:hypothetical protein